MTFKNQVITFLFFLSIFFSVFAEANAQPKPDAVEASYEATLHVLLAAGQQSGTGEAVPQSLSAVARQLRGDFGASNLRLINTYHGRMTNQGTLEYKGVSNAYTPEPQPGSPSFLDWTLHQLRHSRDDSGKVSYYFQSFRFGARVPVRIGVSGDEKSPVPINYESTGLTLSRLSVQEGVPTLIGTLTQPKTDGTLFLLLTVKAAEK
jgi:hypothetical protein